MANGQLLIAERFMCLGFELSCALPDATSRSAALLPAWVSGTLAFAYSESFQYFAKQIVALCFSEPEAKNLVFALEDSDFAGRDPSLRSG